MKRFAIQILLFAFFVTGASAGELENLEAQVKANDALIQNATQTRDIMMRAVRPEGAEPIKEPFLRRACDDDCAEVFSQCEEMVPPSELIRGDNEGRCVAVFRSTACQEKIEDGQVTKMKNGSPVVVKLSEYVIGGVGGLWRKNYCVRIKKVLEPFAEEISKKDVEIATLEKANAELAVKIKALKDAKAPAKAPVQQSAPALRTK